MTWLQLRTYQHFWGLLEFECSGDRNKRDKWRDLLHSQPCSWLAQLVVVLRQWVVQDQLLLLSYTAVTEIADGSTVAAPAKSSKK